MPIYISRGRFTSDAVKGMLAKPENREEVVAKLFESVGGRLIGWYLTFGHHDWLVPRPSAAPGVFLRKLLTEGGGAELLTSRNNADVSFRFRAPDRVSSVKRHNGVVTTGSLGRRYERVSARAASRARRSIFSFLVSPQWWK